MSHKIRRRNCRNNVSSVCSERSFSGQEPLTQPGNAEESEQEGLRAETRGCLWKQGAGMKPPRTILFSLNQVLRPGLGMTLNMTSLCIYLPCARITGQGQQHARLYTVLGWNPGLCACVHARQCVPTESQPCSLAGLFNALASLTVSSPTFWVEVML